MSRASDTVREQVKTLLENRPDLKQVDFGRAIGRGSSWVSAFLAGTRHANSLPLVVKIAKFFGVTVGYLLRESDRGRDAGAMLVLQTYEEMKTDPRRQELFLEVVRSFRSRASGLTGESLDDDDPQAGNRKPPPHDGPRPKKR